MKRKVNEKNLKCVNGQIEGIVYRYILDQKDAPENGWSYVGETMTEKERIKSWRNSGNKSYGGAKCREARDKYGWEAFRYEVLENLYSDNRETLEQLLEEREGYWIEHFDSVEKGFNTSHEGTGQKGVKLTDDQRKKCGDNRRGKPQSEESRKKISSSLLGRTVDQQTREKISKGNTGKTRSDVQRKAESDRLKGIAPMAATQGAKEWVKQNGGGYWKNHSISEKTKAKMKAVQQKRGTSVIATASDGSEKTYTTMLDAAKDMGLGVGSIHNFLKTGRPAKNGYTFRKAS